MPYKHRNLFLLFNRISDETASSTRPLFQPSITTSSSGAETPKKSVVTDDESAAEGGVGKVEAAQDEEEEEVEFAKIGGKGDEFEEEKEMSGNDEGEREAERKTAKDQSDTGGEGGD
jgi:hypothetical protein